MVAYRLHFEPATLAAIEAIRVGKLGALRTFASTFTQNVKPTNHRVGNGLWAGPLYDMGPYPINAVRYLFESEPIEAFAFASRSGDAGLPMDLDHTLSVTLKFPGDRVASFVLSYVAASADLFVVTGAKGSLMLKPAYGFGKPKELTLTVDKKETSETFKPTDHFGGELKYFSDCILSGRDPEPDGEEGLIDVGIIEAIVKSIETNAPIAIAPSGRAKRIDVARVQTLAMASPPTLINTAGPSE